MKTIIQQIIESEPEHCITYEQFMKTVLYHPNQGYYQKDENKVGIAGDFITSPAVHPVFGRVLARFLIELTEAESLPVNICELGAGDGRLIASIVREWERISPSSIKNLAYFAVEASQYHRDVLKDRLHGSGTVQVYESLADLRCDHPSFSGIVISNEFFDALPLRVVQKVNGVLYEVMVTIGNNGELKEELRPCRDHLILDWIEKKEFPVNEKERVEIPLAMTKVIEETAQWLGHGALLTVDYGYTNEDRKRPERREGSLRGYSSHRLVENPLVNPGNMDLTAHIHWDAFDRIASTNGLKTYLSVPQREFMLKSGILDFLKDASERSDPFSELRRQNRGILTLISEDSFGQAFQVMLHGKGLQGAFIENWLARQPVEEAIKKRR